jgi:hypothetical protein
MLDKSPVGIASYSETIGWVGHVAAIQKLQLFGIENSKGSQTLVIAPNKDIAAALYGRMPNSLDLMEAPVRPAWKDTAGMGFDVVIIYLLNKFIYSRKAKRRLRRCPVISVRMP